MNQVPIPLNCFEERYTLRHPVIDDLPELLRLEKVCRGPGLGYSEEELRFQIGRHGESHSVLIVDNHVVGAVYTQRIHNITDLSQKTHRTVSDLRTYDGSIVQLLSVHMIPSMFYLGYGDQLLEFMLLSSSLLAGVEKVVSVIRCVDYSKYPGVRFQDYIQKGSSGGEPVDPMLGFHIRHGAEVSDIISDYRPLDRENDGYGVLVIYDVHHRKVVDNSGVFPVTEKSIENVSDLVSVIKDSVRFILKTKKPVETFHAQAAFFDMGMDGLDLFGLRMILVRKLNKEISPTLFYRYSSPSAIIDYFTREIFPDTFGSSGIHVVPIVPGKALKGEIHDDAIAVVGMSCRFPGARDIHDYWNLLYQGRSGISETPKDRWNTDEFRSITRKEPGKLTSSRGGYLDDVAKFDARFFGMSPREARQVDPQQRLLLELNRDALEYAGIAPDSLKETNSGLFVGIFTNDYQLLQLRQNSWTDYDGYFNTGNSHATAAGRLAYILGCHGPAIAINTACSSAMVAVHLACQSLKQNECDLALGSGVNLMLSPETGIGFSQAGMLSPDGLCKTFDASANGYVRSEGAGVVVLKRLKDALRDNHTIYGIIRGSAINQDGASNGLTAPNGLAQVSLIRDALSQSGLTPSDISYVEAHGTGTSLGDPIEYEALMEVFGRHRTKKNPLIIGSVKTNIGHTEGAAGVAGLIKAILSMRHRYIPAHLNFKEPNSLIDLNALPAVVPTKGMAWPDSENPMCAGVSSFGFSGTNAHMVLQEYCPLSPIQTDKHKKNGILTLSACDEQGLDHMIREYADDLTRSRESNLGDICYTSHIGRTHFKHRLAVCGKDIQDLTSKLHSPGKEKKNRGVYVGCKSVNGVSFLFTGQGAQYVNMGRELYAREPIFCKYLDDCADILSNYMEKPLLSLLFSNETCSGELDMTCHTQPVLFALEYSLASFWMEQGLEPDIMMGHSVGEYVAACLAGVFTLEDGLRLITARARLMQNLPAGGGMAAVLGNSHEVKESLAQHNIRLDIAAYNGPENIVVSGLLKDVRQFVDIMDTKQVKVVPLKVSHAFHSYLMEPMLAEFKAIADTIEFGFPQKKIVSNVYGSVAGTEMESPDYWVDHVRKPVFFERGIQCLQQEGINLFLEVGPKPVLMNMARPCLENISDQKPVFAASFMPGVPEMEAMDHAMATLYAGGADIAWENYHKRDNPKRIPLPTYPYQRQRFWIKTNTKPSLPSGVIDEGHPLLGTRLDTPLKETLFSAVIGAGNTEYLKDHRMGGQITLPAAGYLEIALAAAQKVKRENFVIIRDLLIEKPLNLPADSTCQIQTIVSPLEGNRCQLNLYSRKNKVATTEWEQHGSMKLFFKSKKQIPPPDADTGEFKQFLNMKTALEDPARIDENPSIMGFGSNFQGLVKFGYNSTHSLGQICLPVPLLKQIPEDGYQFHPALMDACFQTAVKALVEMSQLNTDQSLILMGIDEFNMFSTPRNTLWCRVNLPDDMDPEPEVMTADLCIYNSDGSPVAEVRGLTFRKTELIETSSKESGLYHVTWHSETFSHVRKQFTIPKPLNMISSVNPTPIQNRQGRHKVQLLEKLSHHYIGEAFNQLGWNPKVGLNFTCHELINRLDIPSRHHLLMKRLLEIQAEAGILSPGSDYWQVIASQIFPNNEQEIKNHPELETELTILKRFASNLALILKGECDPLTLLFPEGDISDAINLYEKSLAFGQINQAVGSTFSKLVSRIPPGQDLHILEIGAGTGGTTAHLLPLLKDYSVRYTFTDITQVFIRKAKERFAPYSFVDYRLLDIENDPVTQDYGKGDVDIIVAANVLHATKNLSVTLEHIRKLLAPGGILLLVEGSTPRGWIDLIFGVIEGWWKFDDTQRNQYPLMPAGHWEDVLKVNGFPDPVSIIPIPEEEALFPQAIIMAERGEDKSVSDTSEYSNHWLVFGDSSGISDTLTETLTLHGGRVTRVDYGEIWKRGNHSITLDIKDPEHYKRLFHQIPDITHIIHTWALDTGTQEQMDTGELTTYMRLTCGCLLHLIQALAADTPKEFSGLCVMTSGGQFVVPHDLIHPSMAPLWGMVDVIQKEHPEFHCRIIDIDPLADDMEYSLLLRYLMDKEVSMKAAIRKGELLAPRLNLLQVPVDKEIVQETHGTILITGGMGGTGFAVAKHLVQQGFQNLVLLGRNLPEPSTQAVIDDLTRQGTDITVMTGDVADNTRMTSVFEEIKRTMPPLTGILHTAGVFEDSLLEEHTWERFERVFAAKVQGSWNLHLLSRESDLDFFVLFSSAMTLLPNLGLSNYVAANTFMDQLAHYRRHHNLPAVSIAWGPWDDIGMASTVGHKRQDQWAAFGLTSLTKQNTFGMLDYVVSLSEGNIPAHLGVMNVDWSTFANHGAGSLSGFYKDLVSPHEDHISASREQISDLDLSGVLIELPLKKRHRALRSWLRECVATIMGFDSAHQLDVDEGFFQQGMDSLTAMELRGRLQREFDTTLPTTAIFKHPTVLDLTDYLARNFLEDLILDEGNGDGETKEPDIDEPPSGAHDLPSKDIDDSLEAELNELERMLNI